MLSIQTNVNSLIAQENLRVNSDFQGQTINRLTSGYRINKSGDDAAGLAIANKFRSEVTELTQGVRNANDGISTLQIVDGGMNNISKMLDRLKTLATQSASGTFTGDRNVLNAEFQSVLGEIDRQAQAIGLDQGGRFAKALSVFIGGGKDHVGGVDISNGAVTLDLASSTVDTNSLGLKGMQAASTAGTDLSSSSATTSVSQIVNNTANQSSLRTPGFTEFYIAGAGFSGADKIRLTVNTAGIADTSSAVEAINAAIESAAGESTEAAKAFAAAGIKASVVTEDGKERIAFTSSNAAFQVQAGDKTSNALLGNFVGSTAEGKAVAATITSVNTVAASGTLAANQNIVVRVQGGGLAAPVDLTITGNAAGTTTLAEALTQLKTAADANQQLSAAGISLATPAVSTKLAFTTATGESMQLMAAGDTGGLLGLGTFALNDPNVATFDSTTITARNSAVIAAAAAVNYTMEISISGQSAIQPISITTPAAGNTVDTVITQLNASLTGNSSLVAAGLSFSDVGGHIKLTSSNGTAFRVNETTTDATNTLGFDVTPNTGGSGVSVFGTSLLNYDATVNSGGANNSALGSTDDVFAFENISSGGDDQTVSITAVDANGTQHKVAVLLSNDATSRNGATLDSAIDAINDALRQSGDSTMKKIVAVKELNAANNAEGIRFLSPSSVDFQVSVGTNAGKTGLADGATQGGTYTAEQSAGGSTIDIATQAGAQAAVTALAKSVTMLGSAQAAVGKSQNELTYAVSLAQSEISNYSSAESAIRDADMAAEAANLSKAQVLQQATIAGMAQANSASQAVLTLLRG